MRPLVVILGLLVAAPAASASTASVETGVRTAGSELVYTADPREANDVQVSFAGSWLVVRDPDVSIRPGTGCERQGENMVRCSPPEGPSMGFANMLIELADGADRFQNGASLASMVDAGAGDDQLVGGSSIDTFDGGAGRDVLDGGDGRDMVTYAARTARVFVDFRSPANPSGEVGENDSLANFELAHGGAGPDVMRGGNTPVAFFGHGRSDRLFGTFGADRLYGDSGHDKIYGLGGSDRLVGGAGDDGINAGCGRAKLFGGRGRDRLYGQNGMANRLDGGSHRDYAVVDRRDVTRRVERVALSRVDACAL
jgi:Ca2+-binding RTX toxin-like protein